MMILGKKYMHKINSLKYFFLTKKEIKELKSILNQIDNKYRDPESKNKAKQLKLDAQKQIERNKIILKDIIKE